MGSELISIEDYLDVLDSFSPRTWIFGRGLGVGITQGAEMLSPLPSGTVHIRRRRDMLIHNFPFKNDTQSTTEPWQITPTAPRACLQILRAARSLRPPCGQEHLARGAETVHPQDAFALQAGAVTATSSLQTDTTARSTTRLLWCSMDSLP